MDTHIKDLHIALRLYHANFMNLHWNAKGEGFDDAHKRITTDYYDLCYKHIDTTAEMLARLNISCPNYIESAYYIDKAEHHFYMVDSSKLYNKMEIMRIASSMLNDILSLIEASLKDECIEDDPANVGIKSDLESMHSEFDLQARYINARRLYD